jgi:hypothetical protein
LSKESSNKRARWQFLSFSKDMDAKSLLHTIHGTSVLDLPEHLRLEEEARPSRGSIKAAHAHEVHDYEAFSPPC